MSFLLSKCFNHPNPSYMLKYFHLSDHDSSTTHMAWRDGHFVWRIEGKRYREAFHCHGSCCNCSELQNLRDRDAHSFFNNQLCVCIFVINRVFQSRRLSSWSYFAFGFSSSLSKQPSWTRGEYP